MDYLEENYPDTFGEWLYKKWGNTYRVKLKDVLDTIRYGNEYDVETLKDELYHIQNDYNYSDEEKEFYNEVKDNVLPYVSAYKPYAPNLYAVEIPNNNNQNYIEEYKDYGARTKLRRSVEKGLKELGIEGLGRDAMTGRDIYDALIAKLGSKEKASKFLEDLGIVGVHYYGMEDGECYVIFNEKDLKITDHVRFFRTADGEAYGFTYGGDIYIDPSIASSETPIHEYAHLWASALRAENKKEWQNVVDLMKGTSVWDEVKRTYPELKTDDDIADEVLATYSGRRGAERLRKEMDKAMSEGTATEKGAAVSALERVKQAIEKFWHAVADFLHIHYTSAEQVADQVMKDLLDGVAPRMFGKEDSGKARYQFVGEKGAERADHAEEVTTRLDNLNIAREMEAAKKDAKSIKLATGWERGADGKWRYEIPDSKLNDMMDVDGNGKMVKRYEEDMLWTSGKLGEVIVAPELFKAYPKLKDVRLETDSIMNNLPSNGEYNSKTNTITIHADELKYLNSILNHEIQHAIQDLEGFAKGGNPNTLELKKTKEYKDWENLVARLRSETPKEKALNTLIGDYADKYNALANKIDEFFYGSYDAKNADDVNLLQERKSYLEELGRYINELSDELDKIRKGRGAMVKSTIDSVDDVLYNLYHRLAGEVESRNVEKRMGMPPEERRATLAAETEDVSREDQIFLMGEDNNVVSEEKTKSDDELMREGDMRNPNEMSESEKAEIGNALVNAPTIDVASNQIVKTEDMSARKAAEKWWRDNIGEPLFYDTEVGVVEINENSIGTSLAHRYGQAKLDAITSLKDGFKNAVYLGTIKDFIRTEKSVLNHYFAYPINYNGKRCYVFCRAMQDNNKNRLYVHEVFVADNIQEEGNTLQTAAQKPHGGIALYKAILSDALNAANVGNNSELYNFSNEKDEVRQSQERITLPTSVQEQVEAMHLGGEVEVVADGSGFKGKKRKAKGFYNKQTGKITIILGNHTSVEDVMQTLMHEAVAHKGLRKLFGKDFDTFLDKVFAGAEKPIREKIVALAAKNGWNIRTATEEYLASLAEDKETFEKHGGFWEKVRNFFYEMAHKLFPKLVKIGDNEMRYELWRSYENLKNDSSLIAEAKDIAMQDKLKVGNYAEKQGNTFDEDAMLYREERERVDAKHDYEMAMKSASHKFVTAWADSMYSLKQLQDVICKNGNTQIADWENAYMAENRMSSINLAEMETYKKTFYKDMLDAIQSLMKGGVKYQDVVTYMYAKHGLERNKYIQDEEIGKLQQAFLDKYGEKPISRPNDFTSGIDRNDYASDDAYDKACQAAVDAAQKKYDEAEKKLNKKIAKIASSDYSGLSSLFNTNSGFKTAAQQYVSDFEKGRNDEVDKSVEAHTDTNLSLIVDNFISRSLLIFLSLDVPTTTPLAKFSLLILIAVRTKN